MIGFGDELKLNINFIKIMSQTTVNKYYNYNLNFAQKTTEQAVLQNKDLNDKHIEKLCSGYLPNAIYANNIENKKNFEQGREESLKVAAQIIIKNGEQIKEQLDQNAKFLAETKNNPASQNTDNNHSPSNQDQPNTSEDINKISGGTMAQIITEVAKILASMSPEEQKLMSGNITAFFSVLEKSFNKMEAAMQILSTTPAVVNIIKDALKETEGENIINKLIESYFSDNQKEALSSMLPESMIDFQKDAARQAKSSLVLQ